ncbi:MAG: bifunctional diguanylate cyclase/phosphodiesterase [Ruminiclostridium sp.]|nr:bifunctional diguanylate cyclase/phosphodiesterase [Ruminiclostridium sp.]
MRKFLPEEELRSQNEQLKEYNEQILEKEVKLNYISYFDALTGLPNRQMILERLQSMLRLNQNKNPIYIVFFDIDHFKHVNDTLGYRAGDELLNKVTEILNRSMAQEDLAGRLGGDEFALLIQQPMDENSVFRFIDQIRQSISEIEIPEAHNIRTSASFGVSVYPFDGEEEIELMKCADTAMFKAKEIGRNNIQFFRGEMKEEILRRFEREKQLTDALKNVEFFLVFQPQFSLDGSDSIRSFEALIRWRSSRGIISPMEFIPLAEKTGLIIPIGKWVMQTACQMFQKLCEQHDLDALVSVNISAVQMRDEGFIQSVKDVLEETRMDPSRLELEITESMLIDSLEETVQLLKELKALGIHISLDDFGTGYSSLNYLKMLPIDTLKIDKTFVDDVAAEVYSKKLLGDMIHMAHHLNLTVVAEGVETEEQLEFLRTTGCDYAQGYLLGRPEEMSFIQELVAKTRGDR